MLTVIDEPPDPMVTAEPRARLWPSTTKPPPLTGNTTGPFTPFDDTTTPVAAEPTCSVVAVLPVPKTKPPDEGTLMTCPPKVSPEPATIVLVDSPCTISTTLEPPTCDATAVITDDPTERTEEPVPGVPGICAIVAAADGSPYEAVADGCAKLDDRGSTSLVALGEAVGSSADCKTERAFGVVSGFTAFAVGVLDEGESVADATATELSV